MEYVPFSIINLSDPFFESLKADYKEFESWFNKKSLGNAYAYIQREEPYGIVAFLYIKIEEEEVRDVNPILPAKKRVKVGTFKVDAHGTKFGQRFIKKIMDYTVQNNIDEIYLTVFPKHAGLIALIQKYGFVYYGTKETENGIESVYKKNIESLAGDILLDYPLLKLNEGNKYLLSIYPEYHTRLFPDSILKNESYDVVQDISSTNSIHKIYICYMGGCSKLKPKDLLLIYRTSDMPGRAKYRSVVTSVCVVEEMKMRKDFKDINDFIAYSSAYSIFTPEELIKIWNSKNRFGYLKDLYVIKMTYNAAFSKRIINDTLKSEYGIGTHPETYWGFMELTDEQFRNVIVGGKVNENIIID